MKYLSREGGKVRGCRSVWNSTEPGTEGWFRVGATCAVSPCGPHLEGPHVLFIPLLLLS